MECAILPLLNANMFFTFWPESLGLVWEEVWFVFRVTLHVGGSKENSLACSPIGCWREHKVAQEHYSNMDVLLSIVVVVSTVHLTRLHQKLDRSPSFVPIRV